MKKPSMQQQVKELAARPAIRQDTPDQPPNCLVCGRVMMQWSDRLLWSCYAGHYDITGAEWVEIRKRRRKRKT